MAENSPNWSTILSAWRMSGKSGAACAVKTALATISFSTGGEKCGGLGSMEIPGTYYIPW